MQRGITMVELLVALFILAVGLLGLCELLSKSQRIVYEALVFTKASNYLLSAAYSGSPGNWQQLINDELPEGASRIETVGDGKHFIVSWQERGPAGSQRQITL